MLLSIDKYHFMMKLLEYYLTLEKLRFKNKFNYFIKVDEKLDFNTIQIPPMLIQPIAENAINYKPSGTIVTLDILLDQIHSIIITS